MRYLALACDYDGTLARDGRVDEATLAALERFRGTGRKLLLVTGREMPDLLTTFSHVEFFDWIVAENGALLYRPSSREEKPLANPPAPGFVELLRQRGVGPISVGRVIVATWHPHETIVLQTIRDLGLELQVIFNKGAVMILPGGVNKATGLTAALTEMGLSPHNAVGVGDAENDHAFLSMCECSAAVANALPTVKETADLVTRGDHGAGVAELIDRIIADDLAAAEGRLTRHHLLLGAHPDGGEVAVRPYGSNVLIAGPSGSGKSTTATALLERLARQKYQFCIFDPEGDYETYEGAVPLGTSHHGPGVTEVLQLLEKSPDQNVVVNLVGLPLADRPPFFLQLLSHVAEIRARLGRPHWLVIDEAHHLLPASWEPAQQTTPEVLERLLLITVHPDQVAPRILKVVDTLVAVGLQPKETVERFCTAVGDAPPSTAYPELGPGEVVLWRRGAKAPVLVRVTPSQTERRRHVRKYAEGELPPGRSFYFRGPDDKLNLRAQNLILFTQLADGVDDDTWEFHRRQGDYSRWFREAIKDEELAKAAAAVEERKDLSPADSRRLIREAIEKQYTLPTAAPLPMPGTDEEPKRTKD